MSNKTYNQAEILELINQYSNTNRKTIKQNLKRILTTHNLKPKQIIELGYSSPNVYSWLASSVNNAPLLHQALHISVIFEFNIEEFIKI